MTQISVLLSKRLSSRQYTVDVTSVSHLCLIHRAVKLIPQTNWVHCHSRLSNIYEGKTFLPITTTYHKDRLPLPQSLPLNYKSMYSMYLLTLQYSLHFDTDKKPLTSSPEVSVFSTHICAYTYIRIHTDKHIWQ